MPDSEVMNETFDVHDRLRESPGHTSVAAAV